MMNTTLIAFYATLFIIYMKRTFISTLLLVYLCNEFQNSGTTLNALANVSNCNSNISYDFT